MESYENIHLPWPDWRIISYLGSGTYGRVYEIGRNIVGIQEKAALKIISRPKDSNEVEACYDNGYDRASIIESYEKEIRSYVQEYNIMKELQGQSNIVSCDDFAVVPHEDGIGGDIFLRMELLTSLPQILRQQMLSEQEIIKLGKDISRALMLCESKNIIHRDIKPVNIMVSKFGDYKLGDFGVSKIMDHATYATAMGTPEYQAPEVVHMEKYGKTADIYSLGITLYWLLNNRKMPFIGADERLTPAIKSKATERRYRGEQLPPPRDGSVELKQIVLKACAYRPQERYRSAKEMNQALEGLGNSKSCYTSHSFNDGTTDSDFQSSEKTMGREEYGQTVGNSWGISNETIGKTYRNVQKNRAKTDGEEDHTATVGVKQGSSGMVGSIQGGGAAVKGSDRRVTLPITFQEAVFGCEKELEIVLKESCFKCGGTGTKVLDGIFLEKCPVCCGAGYVSQRKKIIVGVPAGIDNEQIIRIRGKGEPGINGGSWGNLLIDIQVGNHPIFRRDGMDIYSEVSLTPSQAAQGATICISTIDGDIAYNIRPGIQSGTRIRLKKKGVPSLKNRKVRGDHYVTLVVQKSGAPGCTGE